MLVVLAAGLLLWQQPWQDDAPSDDGVVPLPADASSQLTTQLRDLSNAGSEADFVAASGALPEAEKFSRRTWRALQAVAKPGASFRYISGGEVADRDDGSATAVVEVAWQPAEQSGFDPAVTHRSTVELRVAPERDGTFSIIGAGPSSSSVPMWLIGDVAVDSGDGRVVVRVDGGDAALPVEDMASAARAAVEKVVPDAEGSLTIVSPRTQEQMAEIVGQPADAVAQIAAITTGLDGDTTSRDAVVVLNPTVFSTMDRRAAQIVLSHEATHSLTPVVGSAAPNWVVEGFADFVALRDDTASLSISAGQVLAEVRAGRTPERLPTDADFGSTRHGLGAVYESAWMIFRMLGENHSDRAIVGFYQRVIGGETAEKALEASFGLTLDELTADWRAYLTKSASMVS